MTLFRGCDGVVHAHDAGHTSCLVARPRLRKPMLPDLVEHSDPVRRALTADLLINAQECTIFDALAEAVEGGWRAPTS